MATHLNGGSQRAFPPCKGTGANLDIGKTAPRLIQDLHAYNPHSRNSNRNNVLTDIYFHDAEKGDEDPQLPHAACQHEWAIKNNQSTLPKDDAYSPTFSAGWIFACCCTKCRTHLDLQVDYGTGNEKFSPCPGHERPLHHFLFKPDGSRKESREVNVEHSGPKLPVTWYPFECSNEMCKTSANIRFKPPRLKSDWVSMLTDKFIIKARAEKAISSDPEKFHGHAPPTPGTVLETLFRLVRIALKGDDNDPSKKPYARDGKSWLLNFGEASAGLMEYLGFTSDVKKTLAPRQC